MRSISSTVHKKADKPKIPPKGRNMNSEEITNFENQGTPAEPSPRRRLPLVCKILYIICALCLLLYILFLIFPQLADLFNRYVSPFPRAVLAKITSFLPFSLAECIIILSPIILIAAVSVGIKHYGSSWRDIGIYCVILLSLGAYVFSTFTIAFVPSYRGSRLDAKMELDKQSVSAEELMYTSVILVNNIKLNIGEVVFDKSGASVMPYGYEELNDKLMDAYDKACKKYDFIQNMHTPLKRILLSEPMTYTHISGVYTFFTGEANINTNFPDYTLPYTAAHELAHQRGIAREDEANFVAFLVCSESDDPYIRYSAYLNLYEYVAGALASANRDYYSLVYTSLPIDAIGEMSAYSQFFDKYRDNVASDISGAVNNTFLTINGTEGTKSYGMVVDLAVAYYKSGS